MNCHATDAALSAQAALKTLRSHFQSELNKIMRIKVPVTDDLDLDEEDLDQAQVKLLRIGDTVGGFFAPMHSKVVLAALDGADPVFQRLRSLGATFGLGFLSKGAIGSEVRSGCQYLLVVQAHVESFSLALALSLCCSTSSCHGPGP